MPLKRAFQEGENRPRGGSLRSKTLAAIWVIAKTHGIADERVYQLCSSEVGRILVKGFGFSTCSDQELLRCVEAVKAAAGLPIGQRRTMSPGPRRRTILPLRHDGERRASLPQYQLLNQLREELGLTPGEFEGIARRATGKVHSSSSADLAKIIEGLKAIRRRRLRATGSARAETPMPAKDASPYGSSSRDQFL